MIALFPALSIRQLSTEKNWTWYMKEHEIWALISNKGKLMLKNMGKLRSLLLETWTDSLLASREWLLLKIRPGCALETSPGGLGSDFTSLLERLTLSKNLTPVTRQVGCGRRNELGVRKGTEPPSTGQTNHVLSCYSPASPSAPEDLCRLWLPCFRSSH